MKKHFQKTRARGKKTLQNRKFLGKAKLPNTILICNTEGGTVKCYL